MLKISQEITPNSIGNYYSGPQMSSQFSDQNLANQSEPQASKNEPKPQNHSQPKPETLNP